MNDKVVRSNLDTLHHIHKVRENIYLIIQSLDERAQKHDDSKLHSPEQEIFGDNAEELAKTEYGTPEYQELLKKVQPAIEHHYQVNRHHPEHWPNGINNMTLVDLIEMLADWAAAINRTKNGDIEKSLEINSKRFQIEDQLKQIMNNTIQEYFKNTN